MGIIFDEKQSQKGREWRGSYQTTFVQVVILARAFLVNPPAAGRHAEDPVLAPVSMVGFRAVVSTACGALCCSESRCSAAKQHYIIPGIPNTQTY